ncbi:hypothetical protein ACLOJK_028816 [Asimina triloba]
MIEELILLKSGKSIPQLRNHCALLSLSLFTRTTVLSSFSVFSSNKSVADSYHCTLLSLSLFTRTTVLSSLSAFSSNSSYVDSTRTKWEFEDAGERFVAEDKDVKHNFGRLDLEEEKQRKNIPGNSCCCCLFLFFFT